MVINLEKVLAMIQHDGMLAMSSANQFDGTFPECPPFTNNLTFSGHL
jgi:hypothetical protein